MRGPETKTLDWDSKERDPQYGFHEQPFPESCNYLRIVLFADRTCQAFDGCPPSKREIKVRDAYARTMARLLDDRPATVPEIAEELGVTKKLVRELVEMLRTQGLFIQASKSKLLFRKKTSP